MAYLLILIGSYRYIYRVCLLWLPIMYLFIINVCMYVCSYIRALKTVKYKVATIDHVRPKVWSLSCHTLCHYCNWVAFINPNDPWPIRHRPGDPKWPKVDSYCIRIQTILIDTIIIIIDIHKAACIYYSYIGSV